LVTEHAAWIDYAATITIPTSTGSPLTWHECLAAPYGHLVEPAACGVSCRWSSP
jgi:hypothetical protein